MVLCHLLTHARHSPTHSNQLVTRAIPHPLLQLRAAITQACRRGYEGWGTPGTSPLRTVPLFRFLASLFLLAGAAYIAWRAVRTLGQGYVLIATVPFWIAEFGSLLLGCVFIMGLWRMIERPQRWASLLARRRRVAALPWLPSPACKCCE
jgi:hypothetical protein